MGDTYRAWRVDDENGTGLGGLRELPLAPLHAAGGVLVRGAYAGVNFKDALSAARRGRIVRTFPCTLGIEMTGVVEASDDPRVAPGTPVIVHGFGLAADRDGGFAQFLQVPAGFALPLPAGLSLREAATVGVAGYTAALAIVHFEAQRKAAGGHQVGVGPLDRFHEKVVTIR